MRRVAVTVAALVLLVVPAAEACFCGGSFCGNVATATTLFEATVVGQEPDPAAGGGVKTIRLSDIRTLRGVAPQVLELQGTSCDLELKIGARYLIEPHEWAPGKFGVSQCGLTRPAVRAAGFHAFLSESADERRPRVWGSLTVPTVDHRDYVQRGGGIAVAGAVVLLDGPVQRTASTSSSGEFAFYALPDGRYGVRVELPASRSDVTAPEPTTLEVGGAQVCAEVDLFARSTARVTGVVVDATGTPVPDVQVDLRRPLSPASAVARSPVRSARIRCRRHGAHVASVAVATPTRPVPRAALGPLDPRYLAPLSGQGAPGGEGGARESLVEARERDEGRRRRLDDVEITRQVYAVETTQPVPVGDIAGRSTDGRGDVDCHERRPIVIQRTSTDGELRCGQTPLRAAAAPA